MQGVGDCRSGFIRSRVKCVQRPVESLTDCVRTAFQYRLTSLVFIAARPSSVVGLSDEYNS